MAVQDTEYPGAGAGDAQAGEAYDLAILDMHMPGMDGATLAARIRDAGHALPLVLFSSLGRKEADRQPVRRRRWPSRCARASSSTRWSRLLAQRRRRPRPRPRRGQAAHGRRHGRAPPAAHPAGRGQRGEPEARAAPAAADGLPRRPGEQRHRGHRVRRAPALRRGADGRADARDGRARSLARASPRRWPAGSARASSR